ncbi:MAG: hypothetical protein HY813_03895 [Candidatus Portnoybacteria bacterium]|nr:hypothetical protein [Candidatus Portnoybacteria bacterium]
MDKKQKGIEFEFLAVIDYEKSPEEAVGAGKYPWVHPVLEGLVSGVIMPGDEGFLSFRDLYLKYLEDRHHTLKEEAYSATRSWIEMHCLGTRMRKISLKCFGEKLKSKEVGARLKELCLRPAGIEDHLAAGEWTLEHGCKFTVVSLGATWRLFEPADAYIKDGEVKNGKFAKMTAVLKQVPDRQLTFMDYDTEWPENVYFAAVPDEE